MVQIRRSSALTEVEVDDKSDRPKPPSKKARVLKDSGTTESSSIINIVQDASSNPLLMPHAKASDKTKLRNRVDSLWKVGAHVSSAEGVANAVTNAAAIGSVIANMAESCNQTYYVFQGQVFRALSQTAACQMVIAFSDS